MSVGYTVGNQWALFTGYRTANTNFSDSISVDEDGILLVEGEQLPIRLTSSGKQSVNFKQNGYFFGGAYAIHIREHVVVTLNAALAVLNGKYDSRRKTDILVSGNVNGRPIAVTNTEDTGIDFDGDTVGLNLGVTLKGRILKSLRYTLGVDGYNYDFDAKKKDIPDLSESVLRLSAGLSYHF